MANTLTSAIPQILLQCLPVLRQNAVLPQLVNSDFGTEAAEQGNAITIAKTAIVTVRDVAASVVAASNQDTTPTQVVVSLSNWKEATFQMSDKDAREVLKGLLPQQGQECVKAVINQVEADIINAVTLGAGQAVNGPGGTTPFGSTSSLTAAGNARKALNFGLAPMSDRYVVLDPAAEAAALITPDAFRFDGAGQNLTQINGNLGMRMGMQWFMDQNINQFTASAAFTTGFTIATAAATALTTALTIINGTTTGAIAVGNRFTIAGGSQVYVIVSAGTISTATVTALGNVTVSVYPAIGSTVASGIAITVFATYVQNLVFQRQAVAFASRPLGAALGASGDDMRSIVDPVSGLALTLAITRESYQSTFRVSCLYGVKLVRPDFACIIAG